MGTTYYGYCDDCKTKIDLDKFYSWSAYSDDREVADIEKENLDDFRNDGWIYRSLRLHWFMQKHDSHRQGVCTEHDLVRDGYAEQGKWPRAGNDSHDEIDWTDPKAGRLVIRTRYGEVFLDYLPASSFSGVQEPQNKGRVNCFRFTRNGREDVLLLTEDDANAEHRIRVH